VQEAQDHVEEEADEQGEPGFFQHGFGRTPYCDTRLTVRRGRQKGFEEGAGRCEDGESLTRPNLCAGIPRRLSYSLPEALLLHTVALQSAL
jgi:hypothetical protein